MLSSFLNGLFQNGEVIVEQTLLEREEKDIQLSVIILRQQYERSLLEMPEGMPAFDEAAAIWAGMSLYRIIQFVLIRQLGPEEIEKHLVLYAGENSAAAIYSADLSLRYLPDLMSLAKGLAPDDPLVSKIKAIAEQWPYSSVGMKLEKVPDPSAILIHPALFKSYTDRIILHKDASRLGHAVLKEAVLAVLGDHAGSIWPELD